MADDIPEVTLDVWVCVLLFERFGLAHVDQVPSRLLQRDIAYLDLHSGRVSEERFTRVPPSIRVFGSKN